METEKNPASLTWRILIFQITLLGLILRLYNLSKINFWVDEAHTIVTTTNYSFEDMMQYILLKDNHPPLYYIFMHFWFKLFSVNEFWARLPSVIFGVVSIPATFVLCRKITSSEAGLFVAFLVSVFPFHIQHSQEARMYSLFLLLSLIYYNSFLNYLENKGHNAVFVISGILMLYTHYFGYLILLSSLSVIIYKFQFKQIRSKEFVLIAILSLPGFILGLRRYFLFPNDFWVPKPSISFFIDLILSYFSTFGIFILLMGLVIPNQFDSNKQKSVLRAEFIFPLIFVLIIPILFSILFSPIFWGKYAIFVSVIMYSLIGNSLSFSKNYKMLNVTGLFVICILLIPSHQFYYNNGHPFTNDWEGTMEYIDDHSFENDIVILNSRDLTEAKVYLMEYYSIRSYELKVIPNDGSYLTEDNPPVIDGTIMQYSQVWIIYAHSTDPQFLILSVLNAMNMSQIEYKAFTGINLFLFSKNHA